MANLKASKKDILVNKRNYDRNKQLKTSLKTGLKSAYAAIASFGDETKTVVASVCRMVDKMTTKGDTKEKNSGLKKVTFNEGV